MGPAEERLGEHHPTGRELDDGLVLEVELVTLEGALEVELDRQSADRIAGRRIVGADPAVATVALGEDERHVGVADQLLGRLAGLGVGRCRCSRAWG